MQRKGEALLTLRSSSDCTASNFAHAQLELRCRPKSQVPELNQNAFMCQLIPVVCVLAADFRLTYPVNSQGSVSVGIRHHR